MFLLYWAPQDPLVSALSGNREGRELRRNYLLKWYGRCTWQSLTFAHSVQGTSESSILALLLPLTAPSSSSSLILTYWDTPFLFFLHLPLHYPDSSEDFRLISWRRDSAYVHQISLTERCGGQRYVDEGPP